MRKVPNDGEQKAHFVFLKRTRIPKNKLIHLFFTEASSHVHCHIWTLRSFEDYKAR